MRQAIKYELILFSPRKNVSLQSKQENNQLVTNQLIRTMADLSNFSLEGKNAWITGASYGIGFNIAKAFVQAGAKNIVFNDINQEALERGLAN
mgnify:FL=1